MSSTGRQVQKKGEQIMIRMILFFIISVHQMSGLATHYGHGWDGRMGASGIQVNSNDPVAAHRTLPFGTIIRVINNDPRSKLYGSSVTVIVFDRGPYGKGRILDMMPHSLWDLAGKKVGGLKVKIEVLDIRYQCTTYKCLAKKLKTRRITDERLLRLLVK